VRVNVELPIDTHQPVRPAAALAGLTIEEVPEALDKAARPAHADRDEVDR
jgi:hypothetical protein